MYFESFAELLAMAGHGVYVWSAYAIGAFVLGWLCIVPARQYRRRLRNIRLAGGEEQR